ncbi:MAG: nicotinamidase [Candidatus Fischerbacteria bacterium RBG_13_37_8]|uniref:Nicotinamidase n=1 Tax=Candidatus Fischerbacteria bacterium RBG_13_37_8 TaxID=1817863 RepID=A0A1F5VXG1_9BACT|nr:MAG: nicotinamidase [Candidatus Fischerbacteria bacterium RBG_13_37_8]
MIIKKKNALLVVDVQNDFCPGGALGVKDGDQVIPVINNIQHKFYKVVATQDWHPEHHMSFAKNHPGKNVYDIIEVNGLEQVLWPVHCVMGTTGADFHPELNIKNIHLIIRKGTNPDIDSYSTFTENDKKTETGLQGYLRGLDITQVFLAGLATDYCVLYSSMDAVRFGFETYVLIDACRGVDVPEHNIELALNTMKNNGIKIITSGEL